MILIKDSITDSINSGVTGICIQTDEDSRADNIIKSVSNSLNLEVKEWNLGYGWVDFKNKRAIAEQTKRTVDFCADLIELVDLDLDNKLIVIKNTGFIFKNDNSIARVQQLLNRIRRHHFTKACVIFIDADLEIPKSLTSYISLFELPLPSSGEIREIIDEFCKKNEVKKPSSKVLTRLSTICSGMCESAIQQILLMSLNKHNVLDEAVYVTVIKEKEQVVGKSSVLEMIPLQESINDIGGLENLKIWLKRKEKIIKSLSKAEALGISPPKGVLITGMPGCGKSLTAKATGSLFQLPLIRLDIGSLLGKYVGESEANMKKALLMAEKISPCVLWVDEIEKAFSGISGETGGGSDVTTRLFGLFLTWLQEKPGAVFVVATANNVSVLPPELLRKGRFDEVFYVDFPNVNEREQIFKIHLESKKTDSDLNYKKLAEMTKGYSGADIQILINEALERVFIQGDNLLSFDLIEKTSRTIIPIEESLKDSIKEFRKTFDNYKLKPASRSEDDYKQLSKDAKSPDPIIRESVAEDEFCPPEILEDLSHDTEESVQVAVLENPNCSVKILENAVKNCTPINWGKSFTMSNASLGNESLLCRALYHPKTPGKLLAKLYFDETISNIHLLKIAQKRRLSGELLGCFKTVKINLPSSIKSGTIQRINVSVNDVVKKGQQLMDIDDETRSNNSITSTLQGLVNYISVSEKDEIESGSNLVTILVPKRILEKL